MKTNAEPEMIASCGMDCSTCSIYRAAQDPAAAKRLAENWRATWQPKAEAGWFRCQGCRGDRSVCWSEDCGLYACCVETKKLEFCSQCDDFPCGELTKWAADYAHHVPALERLKAMRAENNQS